MIKMFAELAHIYMCGRAIQGHNDWLLNTPGVQHGREDPRSSP